MQWHQAVACIEDLGKEGLDMQGSSHKCTHTRPGDGMGCFPPLPPSPQYWTLLVQAGDENSLDGSSAPVSCLGVSKIIAHSKSVRVK